MVTTLVPTKHWRAVGGWDEGVDAWEDWTGNLRLAMAGICGYRLPYPVFTYRVFEGDRMTRFYGGDPSLMEKVLERYRNREDFKTMASCCGGDPILAQAAAHALQGLPQVDAQEMAGGKVRIEYLGDDRGSQSWIDPFDPTWLTPVRLGNNAIDRYADVTRAQAAWLAERVLIRVVPQFDAPQPPEPLTPIVTAADVLTPDAAQVRALRPRGRAVAT